MHPRKMKKLIRTYVDGSPDKRLSAAKDAVVMLEQDRVRLVDSLEHQKQEYTRTREAWESRRILRILRPQATQEDVRDGWFYNVAGWVLTLAEVVLFWVIAASLGVNPLFSVILATVMTWGLKAALLAIWRDQAQPLETKRRLQKLILTPSLILLLLAGGVLLFARVASGTLALALLDGINIALFVISIGCLGLASGLFALGYLLLWSRRAELKYEATEQELAITMRECRVVAEIINKLEEDKKDDHTLPPNGQASKAFAANMGPRAMLK